MLLSGYGPTGKSETPDEQRIQYQRDRNRRLPSPQLVYPPHDGKNQGINREPERPRQERALTQDDPDGDKCEDELRDLLDPPQTCLGAEGEAVDGDRHDVDPAANREGDDREGDNGPEGIARQERGRVRL